MSLDWAPAVDDFVAAAAVVLEVDEAAIRRLPHLGLAESALAAPFASFGGYDAYARLIDKAAILIERLARNHPLPDGNKRVAFALTILFLERNGHRWGEPATERDVEMVERVAAGAAEPDEVRAWIDERTRS
ncbi:MAG: type II toxin-antitoxin system death-on-curing family toxin [Thermoleophilaceae bacterium]|nr:type II toxin-antitoxin system death-on-curing family toxin [Thermoleophilaceae bacterium]